jgi:hypothetical protein
VNRDRTQPSDRRPLVEEVAPDDTAPELRHDGIKAWMPEQTREELGGLLRRCKIGREAVPLGERAECLVAYVATRLRVGGVPGRSSGDQNPAAWSDAPSCPPPSQRRSSIGLKAARSGSGRPSWSAPLDIICQTQDRPPKPTAWRTCGQDLRREGSAPIPLARPVHLRSRKRAARILLCRWRRAGNKLERSSASPVGYALRIPPPRHVRAHERGAFDAGWES